MAHDRTFPALPHAVTVAIYGAGGRAAQLLDALRQRRPDVTVACFLDSFRDGELCGLPVRKADDLRALADQVTFVVIASMHADEIAPRLGACGIHPYFVYDGEDMRSSLSLQDSINYHKVLPNNVPLLAHNYDAFFLGYDDEPVYKELIKRVLSQTMVTHAGLMNICHLARHCEQARIPGSFVECGSCRGGAVALMSLASARFGTGTRQLHVFDSFCGLPEPHKDRDNIPQLLDMYGFTEMAAEGNLTATGMCYGSLEENRHVIIDVAGHDPGRVSFYKGWFQDTIPAAKEQVGEIAILRLDCDWYDSYNVCLDNLFDQVVEGGFVIIDDWCIDGCRDACLEFFRRRGIRPLVHHVDGCVKYLVKSRTK